jgi:ubiquinone/menaquinone biosynthesis C-methylase UbiE
LTYLLRKDQSGFEGDQKLYHRVRPKYPRRILSVIEEIGIEITGNRVLDVGAGTGKLTALLVDGGAQVTAVDISVAMLKIFRKVLSGIPAAKSRAEVLPFKDSCFSAVTAGQAFHWFHHKEALHEFRRVLQPKGWLILVWNIRDPQLNDFIRKMNELLESLRQDAPMWHQIDWKAVIAKSQVFSKPRQREFTWHRYLSISELIDSAMTRSYIARFSIEEQQQIRKELENILPERLREHDQVHDRIRIPFICRVLAAQAR